MAGSLVGCPQLREDDFSAVEAPIPAGGGEAGSDGLGANAGDGANASGGAFAAGGTDAGGVSAAGATAISPAGGQGTSGGADASGGVDASGGAVPTGGVEVSGGSETGGGDTTGGAEAPGGSETGGGSGLSGGGSAGEGPSRGGAPPSSGGAGESAGAGAAAGSAGADAGSAGEAAGPSCGDAVADPGEECDGPDLRGLACEDRGFTGGTLGCDDDCRLDETGCESDVPCDFSATDQTGTIFTGATTGRTSAVRDHSCTVGGSGPDLSVSWIAPATRCYQIEVTSPNDIDTILGVYASCALEEELVCADDGGYDQLSLVRFDAEAGARYAIVVDSFYASDTGAVNVVVSPCW